MRWLKMRIFPEYFKRPDNVVANPVGFETGI